MATKKQLAALRKARAAKKRKALNGLSEEQKAEIKAAAKRAAAAAKSKAAKAAAKGLDFLGTNKGLKIVGGVALGGIVFLVGRKIIKNIKANRLENEAQRQIEQKAAVAASTATITAGDASTIAAGLKAAMSAVGTDEKAIDNLMSRIKNGSDMWLVIKAFGEQPYRFGGYSNSSSARKLNLVGWFREELSGSRMKDIESKLSEWGINL